MVLEIQLCRPNLYNTSFAVVVCPTVYMSLCTTVIIILYALCSCRLPIDTATGEPVYAEASVKGKKKEAVVLCALNVCRLLDSQGMLRRPSQGDIYMYTCITEFSKLPTCIYTDCVPMLNDNRCSLFKFLGIGQSNC